MGYFQVRYNSRVVNYNCRGFIRLATDLCLYLPEFWCPSRIKSILQHDIGDDQSRDEIAKPGTASRSFHQAERVSTKDVTLNMQI